MKLRSLVTTLLIVALLGVTLVAPVSATPAGQWLTGGIQFSAPTWGDLTIWQQYNVYQTNPSTHAAKGIVNWQIYSSTDGWRSINAKATCLAVAKQPDGSKVAVVVARLVSVRGWGGGLPGEHARFWVRDGGTPGSAGDQWMMQSYQWEPEWLEFWPANVPAPDCESFTPDEEPFNVEHGNLIIHR